MADLKRALAALALVCAGCAVLDPQAANLAAADAAVGDALYASRAPASEQRAALSRAQRAFGADPGPVSRLRLAALFALLPAPLRDDVRAMELLAPIADARKPGVGRYAAFLVTQLGEQQRLAREADRLARENERAAREQERLASEHEKREEELRQQVEALREIERKVQQREEKLRRGQR